MIQRSKIGLNFFPRRFRRHVYLRDQSIVTNTWVMCDILQLRYLRSNVTHKKLVLNAKIGESEESPFPCALSPIVALNAQKITLVLQARVKRAKLPFFILLNMQICGDGTWLICGRCVVAQVLY